MPWTDSTATRILGIIIGNNDASVGSIGVDSHIAEHVADEFVRIVDRMNAQKQIVFLLVPSNELASPTDTRGMPSLSLLAVSFVDCPPATSSMYAGT